jgi:uncharacterized protein (TIGR02246 family)
MARDSFRRHAHSWIALAILVLAATPVSAQKTKKNQPPSTTPDQSSAILSDEQKIEQNISEMLAAWQIGDADKMHEHYADDALVVSGGWQAPISGWTNYVAAYTVQRQHMQKVRLDRTNTYTKISGNTAWATYQWEFNGLIDGTPSSGRGHTTLTFEKREGKWLIVLNHTSVVEQTTNAPPDKAAGQ